MSDRITDVLSAVLGSSTDPDALTFEHMIVRAVVIYVVGLAIVRLGKNRLLGRHTGFDIVLGFILGSMLSRGVNGAAPPLPTLGAALCLVLLHWLFSSLAQHSDLFDELLKGRRSTLVEDGEVRSRVLQRSEVSEEDLREALRLSAHLESTDEVHRAYIERNGQISVVPRRREPRVVEVEVREGVQTVRLELA